MWGRCRAGTWELGLTSESAEKEEPRELTSMEELAEGVGEGARCCSAAVRLSME